MKKIIKITHLIDHENMIVKKISWDGSKLKKESKASVRVGPFGSLKYDWVEFRDYLTEMDTDGCLVLGKAPNENGTIVGDEDYENKEKHIYRRTKENFSWHDDFQLCCIDFDGATAGNLTPDEVIRKISTVMPDFAKITKVVKYSSSAWIHDKNDKLLSEINGFHIYFMVNHPERINKIFQGNDKVKAWLLKKLWLNGDGYIKNSNPKDRRLTKVSQMVRTIYDNFIFSPERIIFEASPELDAGRYKKKKEAFIIEGTRDCLDLSKIDTLSEREEKKYLRMVNEAKAENLKSPFMIESNKIIKGYIMSKVTNGKFSNAQEYTGLPDEEIAQREYANSSSDTLMQEHAIELASGEIVTVKEILANLKLYHGQKCNDPSEPDYGDSTIACIYSDQKVPIIHSYAHGGINYRFKRELKVLATPVDAGRTDFYSQDYWLEHFYYVHYDKKDEIYHINGNVIEKYSFSGFRHRFAGYFTTIGEDEMPITAWWLNNVSKQCIEGDGFAPGKPIIYRKHGKLVLNEYVPQILHHGFDVPNRKDYEHSAFPLISHIKEMIHNPEEAEILIDWLTYLVQFPDKRPMWSPLIISGTRGVGKDMTTDIWSEMMGSKYAKKSTIKNLSKGDGWGNVFYQTKLIIVSECGSADDRYTVGNTIKDNITSNSMEMNIKGKDVLFGKVYAGIIFFSNSQSPFRLDENDRRFFVTRCDWSKKEADEYKQNGHFEKLASFYSDPIRLYGLYTFFLNRVIKTDMKGDAPMTATKNIMMHSEPNDIEQFFVDLKKHPCKYWTTSMIKELYFKELGTVADGDNKQFNFHIKQMVNMKKMKIKGKSHRLKTFSIKDAEIDPKTIRRIIEDHWSKTIFSLKQSSTVQSLGAGNVMEMNSSDEHDWEHYFENAFASEQTGSNVGSDDHKAILVGLERLRKARYDPERQRKLALLKC